MRTVPERSALEIGWRSSPPALAMLWTKRGNSAGGDSGRHEIIRPSSPATEVKVPHSCTTKGHPDAMRACPTIATANTITSLNCTFITCLLGAPERRELVGRRRQSLKSVNLEPVVNALGLSI